MPVYVAIFSLSGLGERKTYETLSSVVDAMKGSLEFADAGVGVPAAVLFSSPHSIEKVKDQLEEHLHPSDQMIVVQVLRGLSEIREDSIRQRFLDLMSSIE